MFRTTTLCLATLATLAAAQQQPPPPDFNLQPSFGAFPQQPLEIANEGRLRGYNNDERAGEGDGGFINAAAINSNNFQPMPDAMGRPVNNGWGAEVNEERGGDAGYASPQLMAPRPEMLPQIYAVPNNVPPQNGAPPNVNAQPIAPHEEQRAADVQSAPVAANPTQPPASVDGETHKLTPSPRLASAGSAPVPATTPPPPTTTGATVAATPAPSTSAPAKAATAFSASDPSEGGAGGASEGNGTTVVVLLVVAAACALVAAGIVISRKRKQIFAKTPGTPKEKTFFHVQAHLTPPPV